MAGWIQPTVAAAAAVVENFEVEILHVGFQVLRSLNFSPKSTENVCSSWIFMLLTLRNLKVYFMQEILAK
jgi:hypothetical protein